MANENLKKLLKALGIEDDKIDETVTTLTSDEENEETQELVLKASQEYSKPFIKQELDASFKEERNSLKGKYFQDAARQLNDAHETKLSEKEFKETFKEKGYAGVVEELHTRRKPGDKVDESEVKKALDKANEKIDEMTTNHKEELDAEKGRSNSAISEFKTKEGAIKELASRLKKKTNKPAEKHAKALYKLYQGEKGILKMNEQGEFEVYDPKNPENALKVKGSDTKFVSLDHWVDGYVEEFELKAKAPPQGPPNPNPPNPNRSEKDEIQTSSSSMANFLKANKEE